MSVDEIVAEMHRKPDADFLLEWIDDHLATPQPRETTLADISAAIHAYHVGIEGE